MAEDHVLRIVVDPTAARSGSRGVTSALTNVSKQAGEAAKASDVLADAQKRLEAEQRRAAQATAQAAEQQRRAANAEAELAEQRRAAQAVEEAAERRR